MSAPCNRFLGLLLLLLFAAGCSQIPVPSIKMPSIKAPSSQGDGAAQEDSQVTQVSGQESAVPSRPRTIEPAARRLFDQSLDKIEQGDLPAARLLLTELTSLYPDFPEGHYNLGHVLEQTDEPELATIAYQAAVKTDSGFCPAQIRLALMARTEYRFDDSETAYQQCLDRHPDNATAHFNLGVLYEIYLGRYADAVTAYERFQTQQEERDRRVDLWINDLKRRMPAPPAVEDTATVQTTAAPSSEESDNDQT